MVNTKAYHSMSYVVGVGQEKIHHYHSFSSWYIVSKSSIIGLVDESVGAEVVK